MSFCKGGKYGSNPVEVPVNLEQLVGNPEYIFYAVIAVCVVVVTVCFVMLVSSLRTSLARLRKTLDVVNERAHQLEPILDGVARIEENLNEAIGDAQVYLEKLQDDATKVLSEVAVTLGRLQQLQQVLEERLDKDVPPILEETRELVSGVNDITRDVQKKVKAADELFEAIEETGETVRMVTGIMRGGFTGLAVQLASLAVGMKASLEYVADNIHKGGEDK